MPHQATIIGAGPAGSVAAVALLQRGWEVTLIEQHGFPREKVCGECLSSLGIEVLERLGLVDEVARLRPVKLFRTILHSPTGHQASTPLPRPMWGLSRAALDTALLQAAVMRGASLLQPVRCERIEPLNDGRQRLRLRLLTTNQMETVSSNLVLLADGKGALLPGHRETTGDLGIKAHFTNVSAERDAIELFSLPGHYGGLAAIEPNAPCGPARWNAAFSVPATWVKAFRGDLAALLAAMIERNPALQSRLGEAQRIGPILAAPLPRFGVTFPRPAQIIPLGNAAAALEPIGGEGMGLAMRSAELAAIACDINHSPGEAPRRALRSAFRRLWTSRRLTCRLAARALSIPLLAEAAVELAAHNPPALHGAMRLLGKRPADAADSQP